MIAEDFFFMLITRIRAKERNSYHKYSDRVKSACINHWYPLKKSKKTDNILDLVQAIMKHVIKLGGKNETGR